MQLTEDPVRGALQEALLAQYSTAECKVWCLYGESEWLYGGCHKSKSKIPPITAPTQPKISPPTTQPKLRDVYEFAATTISGNAAALALEALVPEVTAAVGEQLTAAAVTVRQGPGGGALLPEQIRNTVATGVTTVLPQLHTQVCL